MRLPIDFLESYSREAIIDELRRIAEDVGKQTLSREDIDRHGRLSSQTVIKKFGSLRRAHQEAKLVPARFMKATEQELCAMLIDLWTKTLGRYGRSPFRTELRTFGFPVSGDTYVRKFGSWNKALAAAGAAFGSPLEQDNGSPDRLAVPPGLESQVPQRTLSLRTRFFVFKRDQYRCRICGRSGIPLEVDHIVPRQPGGSDRLDNLQTLCFDCNRGKRNSFQ